MKNYVQNHIENAETQILLDKLLHESRQANTKRLNLAKIPLESIEPSISSYKKQARSLQLALQKHREKLIAQDKISLQTSLHIVSHLYGFENWQTLVGTMEDYTSKEFDPELIKYIENIYQVFLDEINEKEDFFNDEFFGDKEEFIANLSKTVKNTSKLARILCDERIIDKDVVSLIIDLVMVYCHLHIALFPRKIERFIEDLWDSKNIDEIGKFDPISFSLADLDKLQIIFGSIRVEYPVVYLIHSARILVGNNQSLQQVSKIINILVYCISTLSTENPLIFGSNKALKEKLAFGASSLNFKEIAERYFLV